MFFTREDILKIQQALLQLGVKDSELPSAKPVTYDDTLSIVQDGKNKQIGVKDFCNQISLWKREDFINITDKYDKHYISLIKAINLVPILQRKDGLVITFQDVEGNWEIYQFRGNITEFFEENKWFNLYDYRNNIIQSIVPDEEDLTASIPDEKGNSLVSLKDRVYDPTSFSGKGYKILRKNIKPVSLAVTKIIVGSIPTVDGAIVFTINGVEVSVDMVTTTMTSTDLVAQKIAEKLTAIMTEYEVSKDASTITLTRKFGGAVTASSFSANSTGAVCTITDSTKTELRNIITKDMINQSNTIYEIRYDFDLNGVNLALPNYSTLKFCGGSLKNGSLNLYKCNIQAPKQNQIFDNVIISSTTIYPEWFGAKGDASSDDSDVFNYIGNLYVNIKLQPGKTYILKKNVKIIQSGTSFYIPNYTTIKASDDFSDTTLLTFRGRNPYGLFGNKIYGNGTINGNCRAAIGVSVAGSINTLISDIQILDCKQNGLRCRLDSNPEQYGYDGAVVVNNLRVYNDNVEGSNEGIVINLPDSYLNNSIIKGYKVGVSAISSCMITNVHVWRCDTFATCYGSPVFQNAYSDGCKVVFNLAQSGDVNCNGLYWYNDSKVENEMSLADIKESVWSTLQVTNIYEQPNKSYNLIKTKELANHCNIFIDSEKRTSFRNYDFIVNAESHQPFYNQKLFNIYEWYKEGTYYVTAFTNQIKQEFSFWNIDNDSILIVKIKSLGGNACIQDITFINSNKKEISNAKRIVNNHSVTYLSITTSSDSIIDDTNWYLIGSIYTNKNNKVPYIFLGEKKRILYTDNYDNKGTSVNRPQLVSKNEGFEYYDTTLKKKILWNGTAWVNMDGTELAASTSNEQGAENPS